MRSDFRAMYFLAHYVLKLRMLAPDANLVTDYVSKTSRVEEGTPCCCEPERLMHTLQGTGLRNYLMIEKFCSLVLKRGGSFLTRVMTHSSQQTKMRRKRERTGQSWQ